MNIKVLIIGGGFGGIAAAKTLANRDGVEVTLVDRTNHHLFQPLLYQVATAGLSAANIAQPIRAILTGARNVTVIMANVKSIDPAKKQVITDERPLDYDFLIVAAGARHSYFGHDEWEPFAPGLKTVEDALELRHRILYAFEVAEKSENDEQRAAALTFVVIGAGPTGVEMAGSIVETAKFTLRRDFRRIDPTSAKVILLDAAPRVLPTFHEDLSAKALRTLTRMGVEVCTGAKVNQITANSVEVDGRTIQTQTIIWAAGNTASPLGKSLGVPLDRAGRVIVNADLTVPEHPEIYVVGDMASFSHTKDGKPLPGVSPVAMQMASHAAKNILSARDGGGTKPFRYFDKGSMATIGRHAAVADMHFVRFDGFPAWLAWLFVHLIFLVDLRSKIRVLFQWAWAYATFSKSSRIIVSRGRDVKE